MKINVNRIFTALCAIGVVLAMTACVDQDVKRLNADADLVQLWIGTVIVTDIPAAITRSSWESENVGMLYGEQFKGIDFKQESDITNARIRPVISQGATAEYGIGTRGSRPDVFYDTRVPATFGADDFIYIKVTAEDMETVNYYRYMASVFSWVNDLGNVSVVGGDRIAILEKLDKQIADNPDDAELKQEREQLLADRRAKANSGALDSANAPVKIDDEEYVIYLTRSEATSAKVIASTFDPNATIRYGTSRIVSGNETEPDFVPDGTAIEFKDGDYLTVEVTAQNTIDKKYFKFQVYVGRITTIKSLKFTTEAGDVDVYGLGLPSTAWNRVGPGSFSTASVDQPPGGFGITIALEDPEGTPTYMIFKYPAAPPSGNNPPAVTSPDWKTFTNDTTAKESFSNNDYIVIRIWSKVENVRRYYKIQINLLAANIAKQPRSAWYYASWLGSGDDPAGNKAVAPLTIVLNPPDTGQYTYQWYESDSLFGIYGRHGVSIDEKNNISTINGGPDMYYYLVQPGINQQGRPAGAPSDNPRSLEALAWEADVSRGAKTASYTPRTDWKNAPRRLPYNGNTQNNSFPVKPSSPHYNDDFKAPTGDPALDSSYDPLDIYKLGPNVERVDTDGKVIPYPDYADNLVNFLTGSTSEVRYYWVVVTNNQTQLTVTSDRAVILTETTKGTKHFIFELSDLPRRKNVVPFAYLREPHHIPIPAAMEGFAGFNPADYDTLTAQAQYFLPDGRPWTQNWTHGDLLFGYTEGSASWAANDNGPVKWWHNNLGANAGAIPFHTPHSGEDLKFKPDYIGFQPSGDKARGIPPMWDNPFTNTRTLPIGVKPEGYKPEGAAQGYFCGFIELMEVRFVALPK